VVGDWVRLGADCSHLFDTDQAKVRTVRPSQSSAQAHCHFHLGQYLLRQGRETEAQDPLVKASRLHPTPWNTWRQAAEKNATGLAASAEFWARVNDLGDDNYYPPVDMAGMPR